MKMIKTIIAGSILAASMGATAVTLSCEKEGGRSSIQNFTVSFESWQKSAYFVTDRGTKRNFSMEKRADRYSFDKETSSGSWYAYEIDRTTLDYNYSGKNKKGRSVSSYGTCEITKKVNLI